MVKALVFFRRKPGLSVADFQSHWLNEHAEIVLGLSGIKRYVQSHVIPSGYKRGDPAFDGVAELWFDDVADMRAHAGSEAYARVQQDEERFIDRSSMGMLITDEHVIKEGPLPETYVKNIELVTRKPGMSVEAFQHHWRSVHGPLGASIPPVLRYVQCHLRSSAYRLATPPAYDGAAITWFADTDAMRYSATTDEYEATMADEPNFIDRSRLPIIITTEHVIVDHL
jgi:uncharacterized protein (TIGR02118 family)